MALIRNIIIQGGEDMDDILKNLFGNFHSQGGSRRSGFHSSGSTGSKATAVSTVREQQSRLSWFPGSGLLTASILARAEVTAAKSPTFHADIHVTYDEAAFGGKKLIHLRQHGAVQSYEVNIPAGIETGKSIRLRKGSPGIGGGEAEICF